MDQMKFGAYLKELRKEKNLTQNAAPYAAPCSKMRPLVSFTLY